MTRPTRVAAFYLAVVFVAGGLFGFVAHGLYTQKAARAEARPNPREFRERYIAKLRSDLSLEPGQVAKSPRSWKRPTPGSARSASA